MRASRRRPRIVVTIDFDHFRCIVQSMHFSILKRCLAIPIVAFSLAHVIAVPSGAASAPTLEQMLDYPYVSKLVGSARGDEFAWVEDVRGVRNIWIASVKSAHPRQLTQYTSDDGQELTGLTFSADASLLLYVRGGDHDANWAAKADLAPDPLGSPVEAKVSIWSVSTANVNAAPVEIGEGDSPAISNTGDLVYVKDGQIWTAPLSAEGQGANKAHRLLFDRGKDNTPVWSPDGKRLAFVSSREDHSFVGIFTSPEQPIVYLAPSTSFDRQPVWSPDSQSVAYLRQRSSGDLPENFLEQRPHPFAFWIADASTGEGRRVWGSPNSLAGSLPDITGDEPLFWMADNKLVFLAETDNWPHLYAVDTGDSSEARLLTPGAYMVESVAQSVDRRSLVFSANTGKNAEDNERRHLYRVRTDGRPPEAVTSGEDLEWSPVALAEDSVAYVTAGAQRPASVAIGATQSGSRILDTGGGKDYPSKELIIPKLVRFKAPDGLTIEGQLFRGSGSASQPAIIFVHGGPPRQMLLGWHSMGYYSNAYALNQYMAAHGFTVLSVNYRLGIGYGRAFQHPAHAGPAGAAEYQDVLAAARFLQNADGVDAKRIGIWGGSYGGYLTGLALARNSDVFKAGVDLHGLSNWVPALSKDGALPEHWYEADAGWKLAVATAFASSPDADIAKWRSPVLLIQGDDDRNVPFDQTVELAHRLEQHSVPFEELVLPNEIHGFLRWSDWLHADQATVAFFMKQLGAPTLSQIK
jgi:dipeptidyl aminopeptidase/acylaminoacyl peptidase